jgi:hypothetical protein
MGAVPGSDGSPPEFRATSLPRRGINQGENMSINRLAASLAAVMAGAVLASAGAYAQTRPVQAWTPPQGQEPDPAKRLPAVAQPAAQPRPEAPSQQPLPQPDPQGQYAGSQQQAYGGSAPYAQYEQGRGGFFVGLQAGKGWVYDDVDQSARAINAGYRWQAGPVALVGIEVARGQLGDTTEDGWYYEQVEYASIGANARFNFGATSPVYALVRAGYMTAEDELDNDVDGAYVGLGLGVDFNRHFNVNLVYTNYVYFNEYYWYEGDFYYDASRADMLMLGIEARF